MSGLVVTDAGTDVARLLARLLVNGQLIAAESADADTFDQQTLMEQLQAALAPLAAGGAWPGRNTSDPPTYPYLTFFRVVRAYEMTMDGPTDVQATRIQIDSISNRYAEAAIVAHAARDAMLAKFVIGSIDEQDFSPDPDVDAYRCSADYIVWSVNDVGTAPSPAPSPSPTPSPAPSPAPSSAYADDYADDYA